MSELGDAALAYGNRGWHVFPLRAVLDGMCTCGRRDCSSPGKHPLTRHGVKDASNDPDVVREWWLRWPLANIGIATGERSRLVVVDIDLSHRSHAAFGSPGDEGTDQDKNVRDSLERLVHKLPRTLTSLTGGRGLHLLYRARFQERVRNRTSSLPSMPDLPGVDFRGDGGYIVAPPSLHISGNRYTWLELGSAYQVVHVGEDDERQENDQRVAEPDRHASNVSWPIADAPDWLEDEPRGVAPAVPPSPPRFTDGAGTRYGLAALAEEVQHVGSAAVGRRNHTLNRAAFCLAQLVAGGELSESAARSSLLGAALAIGLGKPECRQTIESGFTAGLRSPRTH